MTTVSRQASIESEDNSEQVKPTHGPWVHPGRVPAATDSDDKVNCNGGTPGSEATNDSDEEDEPTAEDDLAELGTKWNAPVYVFFKPTPTINSTSNLRRHAKTCWGDEVVAATYRAGDLKTAHEVLLKDERQVGNSKATYSYWQHTKIVAHAEFIHWVSEDKRPFQIVNDHAFCSLMKTGRLECYIPSAKTLSCNVKSMFLTCGRNLMARWRWQHALMHPPSCMKGVAWTWGKGKGTGSGNADERRGERRKEVERRKGNSELAPRAGRDDLLPVPPNLCHPICAELGVQRAQDTSQLLLSSLPPLLPIRVKKKMQEGTADASTSCAALFMCKKGVHKGGTLHPVPLPFPHVHATPFAWEGGCTRAHRCHHLPFPHGPAATFMQKEST
ncbi:hypothetical protein EDB92DRAFT_1821055 [Lactarius akahatsu]|uniref:Uncharacterized protein n=1 Tax=Lactarius akahatsu TaxID=416441 RepID=A0AAD4L8E3_9AGAM|nr:hypothetical protein EDB92DRAFT_1821055 [Lactarius akahatsu]